MGCSYCNGKKSDSFDNTLNPTTSNIEFQSLVREYQNNPTENAEKAVREELSIDQEMLGFKYWITKDNPQLYSVFAKDIVWN